MQRTRFLIGAPTSGAGKTTVTLGLMRLLHEEGMSVRPFKCGPDYIDGQFHELATGRSSINLDLFMMSEGHVRDVFRKYAEDADAALVEGVMGLFDGAKRDEGSSAEIAALLGLPVILVIDASAVAYSVAPLIHGFNSFREGVRIAGVVFNKVGSPSHYEFLEEACEDAGVRALGHIPKDESAVLPSRHLGLSTRALKRAEGPIQKAAELLREGLDLETLNGIGKELSGHPEHRPEEIGRETSSEDPNGMRILIASDDAFSFIYRENVEAMKKLGELRSFSPLAGDEVPENVDLLYLSGGYPEDHLETLSANERMLRSLRTYSEKGGRIIAECGGMMLLGRSVMDEEGKEHPMAGVFSFRTSMEPMKPTLGYRRIEFGGREFRGHEFHYSVCSEDEAYPSAGRVLGAREQEVSTKLYLQGRTFASYIHLYWGEGETLSKLLEGIDGEYPEKDPEDGARGL